MQLQVVEHHGQRVLTTQQVAEAYGTDTRRISENFTRNAERYIHGKHFYLLERHDKWDFLDRTQIADGSKHASTLYLWTERGAFLHAKSLNTDKAWAVYESLVENYFSRKSAPVPVPSSAAEMLLEMAKQFVEQEKRMGQIEMQLEVHRHRLDTYDHVDVIGDKQQRLNAMIRKYAYANGATYAQAWREFRASFNTAYRTNLTALVENYCERHGLRDLSMPEYLARADRLDDALRVADKLLNPVGV